MRPKSSASGAARIAIAVVVALLALLVPQASAQAAQPQAPKCPVGPPAIGLTIQWLTQDQYYLVMRPNVVVQNCASAIRSLSIKVETFNNGRPINDSIGKQSTLASKYGNKKMTVRWYYYPAAYHGEDPTLGVGPVLGIGVVPFSILKPQDKQRGFMMDSTCVSQVNGLPVDNSAVLFRVTVYPRDAKGRIMPSVPAAVKEFGCLQAG
jgi:hypothetical protein